MSKTGKYKKGFTIIEVVLVLAVAGLIFLMVFVALPALQRNQRDTQRRQDYGDLSAAVSGYMASNGHLPKAGTPLSADKYINDTGKDPNQNEYTIIVCEAQSGTSDIADVKCDESAGSSAPVNSPTDAGSKGGNEVYVVTRANCDGTNGGAAAPKYVNSGRSFAIYGYMESTATYCQASS
ncbi:type II secretion system protein [Candidatus Saccharibacteria bacterium]|nr:type II secretion system protein [Candidatus Saccharibacteria bacterium]